KGGLDSKYRCEHYDGKGRVADWMMQRPSVVSDAELSWTVVTSGSYMEMLNLVNLFGPSRRADGTFVFYSPVEDSHVAMIALKDLDFFVGTSGKGLEVASDMVSWLQLVEWRRLQSTDGGWETLEQWAANLENSDRPVAIQGGAKSTFRQNFYGWWSAFRDDVIKRDMDWIRKVHPNGYTLDKWMAENQYDRML
ncbi:hypothetical protein BJV78DRAFT_1133251, partial [Lactifluus subvellereus]